MCKNVVEQNSTDLTELELTALASADAMRAHPTLGKDAAFAKVYADPASPNYAEFWKAIAVAKAADMLSIKPVYVGVGGTADDDASVNDAEAAYKQLEELAERQRANSPDLTKAQAFERAFRANPQLAAKAHRRPRPTTSFAWPK